MPTHAQHRGLSTARSALQATGLVARTPDGVRADEVADVLGKSASTAYNLLASLCDEGVAVRRPGGVYGLAREFRHVVAGGAEDERAMRDLRVVVERGLQGMPKLPGMSPEIRDNAHALALGKVVPALSPPEALDRYLDLGLRPFTPSTITTEHELRAELETVRRTGMTPPGHAPSVGRRKPTAVSRRLRERRCRP